MAAIIKASTQSAESGQEERPSAPPLAVTPRDGTIPRLHNHLEHRTGEAATSAIDLDNLLVSANIAMLLLDRRKCIQRFTPAATALFSLLPSDVGRPIRDLSPKFVDPTFLSDILLVLDGQDVPRKEVQTREGHWYVRQALPYLLRDGSVEGAVITFSEVAADALQEARLYAESIVDSVREPLLVLDEELRVHSINHPFRTLFRVTNQEVVGRDLRTIAGGVWNVPALLWQFSGVLASGEPMESFELPYASEALGPRALLLSARTVHRGGGRPALILVAVDDVTEKRSIDALLKLNETRGREEEHIRWRQRELTSALRVSTVGELATGLAHELNQPLSSISYNVEACERYVRAGMVEPDKLLELLAEVAGESMRAAGIVAHLRSFVEKGEPQLEKVDLVEVVRHVPHLLFGELERCGIEFRLDLPAGRLPLRADKIQIEQVIVNLLQNAIDSVSEAGRFERRIELSARSVGGMAEVSVRDTGTGVPESNAARLFEPFFTTKAKGLGMGLALSRSILEAHRGRIWMEAASNGEPGTVVRFSIPLGGRRKRRKEAAE